MGSGGTGTKSKAISEAGGVLVPRKGPPPRLLATNIPAPLSACSLSTPDSQVPCCQVLVELTGIRMGGGPILAPVCPQPQGLEPHQGASPGRLNKGPALLCLPLFLLPSSACLSLSPFLLLPPPNSLPPFPPLPSNSFPPASPLPTSAPPNSPTCPLRHFLKMQG